MRKQDEILISLRRFLAAVLDNEDQMAQLLLTGPGRRAPEIQISKSSASFRNGLFHAYYLQAKALSSEYTLAQEATNVTQLDTSSDSKVRALLASFRRLSFDQRAAMSIVVIERLSVSDAAQIMQTSEKAVRAHIANARHILELQKPQ